MNEFPLAQTVASLALGTLLLFAGRKLFWLALAVAGFAAGLWVATRPEISVRLPPEGPEWVPLAVALVGGVLGLALAVFVQKIAVALGGFLVAGAAGAALLEVLAAAVPEVPGTPTAITLAFVGAGILGALFANKVFNLALLAVTAATGAGLLVEASTLEGPLGSLLFLVLAAVGLAYQWRDYRRRALD